MTWLVKEPDLSDAHLDELIEMYEHRYKLLEVFGEHDNGEVEKAIHRLLVELKDRRKTA